MLVEFEGGKYAIEMHDEDGRVRLLRYSEYWEENPLYAKMLIAVAFETDRLRAEVASLKEQNAQLQQSFTDALLQVEELEEELRVAMQLMWE